MLQQPWIGAISRIVSSDEVKALETAEILSHHTGVPVEVRPNTGEIDRSTPGFVNPDRFEFLTDRFFADPSASPDGWERAVDAQVRIVAELDDLLSIESDSVRDPGDVTVIGHGGVGTLWYCHLAGTLIDRGFDQPGQGHYFTVDRSSRSPHHWWRPIDQLDPTS